MPRARIWISEVRAIGHTFIIEHDDGRLESYPLRTPPVKGDRIGSPYRGEFKGVEGTYYDLPFGFPTSNELAQQRLGDPSIPAVIKRLIEGNFPLRATTQVLGHSHAAEIRAPHIADTPASHAAQIRPPQLAQVSDGERILGQLIGVINRSA